MTFTVTYRSKGGGLRNEVLEARDRADVFAQAKSRGIIPTSVKEGGVLRQTQDGARKIEAGWRRHLVLRGIFAGITVVLLLAATWFLIGGKGDVQATKNPTKTVRETPSRMQNHSTDNALIMPRSEPKKKTVAKNKELVLPQISENRIDRREKIPEPKPLEELQTAIVKPKPTFKHGAEQLLAMATPSTPGGYVPPLPEITDEGVKEDLERAMKDVIKPSDDDTEESIERKLTVAEQKEEFRELNASGTMTFTQYLNALRDKFNEDAEFLSAAHKMNDKLYHDAEISDEEYKAYRSELNAKLKERGLPELE